MAARAVSPDALNEGTESQDGRANAQIAYERIRESVVEWRYTPGERLTEQRLATELGISRTPIREALHRLSAEGLVLVRPNRGALVRPVTIDWIVDLYEFRATLEGYAAKRAAIHATPADVVTLSDAIDGFDRAIETAAEEATTVEGFRALSLWNNEFHSAVVRAGRHAQLETALARSVDIPLVYRAFRRFSRSEHERSNMFHRMIRDAIADGEADRAAGAMAEHIYLGRDVLIAEIRESGDLETWIKWQDK
jgi:DNA-binding GntR family transcriptional regulator